MSVGFQCLRRVEKRFVMRLVTIYLIALALTACGPSQEEIDNTAIITCNIMGESRNMDAAMRIKEINAAREKIGADPYLGTDATIKESFEWGLCIDLVKDGAVFQTKLGAAKAAFRIEQEKLEREAELARLEEERLEKQRREQQYSPITMEQAMSKGESIYQAACLACHGVSGEGGLGSALQGSTVVMNNQRRHAEIVVTGVRGTAMQAFGDQFTASELASVMTYSANAFGNESGILVQPADLESLIED